MSCWAIPRTGTTRGLWSYLSFGQAGDQRLDEALSLTYTSDQLEETLVILGQPEATLKVTSVPRHLRWSPASRMSLRTAAPNSSPRAFLTAPGVTAATGRSH